MWQLNRRLFINSHHSLWDFTSCSLACTQIGTDQFDHSSFASVCSSLIKSSRYNRYQCFTCLLKKSNCFDPTSSQLQYSMLQDTVSLEYDTCFSDIQGCVLIKGAVYSQRVCLPCNCALPSVPIQARHSHLYIQKSANKILQIWSSNVSSVCTMSASSSVSSYRKQQKRPNIALTLFAWLYLSRHCSTACKVCPKNGTPSCRVNIQYLIGQWRCCTSVCIDDCLVSHILQGLKASELDLVHVTKH